MGNPALVFWFDSFGNPYSFSWFNGRNIRSLPHHRRPIRTIPFYGEDLEYDLQCMRDAVFVNWYNRPRYRNLRTNMNWNPRYDIFPMQPNYWISRFMRPPRRLQNHIPRNFNVHYNNFNPNSNGNSNNINPNRTNSNGNFNPNRTISNENFNPNRTNSNGSFNPNRTNSNGSFTPNRTNSNGNFNPNRTNSNGNFSNINRNCGNQDKRLNQNKNSNLNQNKIYPMQLEYELSRSFAVDPTVFDDESPGIDFYYPNTGIGIVIQPREQAKINTHVVVKLPKGIVGIIMDKSSVVTRKQLKVEAGLIDTGYRGEIMIVLRNMSDDPIEISPGEAIAQMLLQRSVPMKLIKVDKIEANTNRGTRGFGEKQSLERKDEIKSCEIL